MKQVSLNCAMVLILCFFYKVSFAQGEYQANYEAIMKKELASRQTEFYSEGLSYRLDEGYAFYSHVVKTTMRKQATFALVSFDVDEEKKGLLKLFCREHARELLLREWLREFLQTHLEEAINERLDAFEEVGSFPSKSGAIEDARGAVSELLLSNAFAQFDLESICKGVLGGCQEKTEVVVNTPKGRKAECFFFAQYSVDEKTVEKNVSEDVKRIEVAWRRVLLGELSRLVLRQGNANGWSEGERKLMRAYVVLIYVLGGDSVSWQTFCAGESPLVQASESFRWNEYIDLIFRE